MKLSKYKIGFILVIVLILISLITLIMPSKQFTTDSYETINKNISGEFKNDNTIKQEFIPTKNYIAIGLPIATYGKTIEKGFVYISIQNEQKKAKTYKVDVSTLVDNEYYYLKYKFKKNKKYTVEITSENLKDPITFLTTSAKIKNAKLTINDEENNNNIILSFMYSENNYFNIWYCLFGISIILCFMTLVKENK